MKSIINPYNYLNLKTKLKLAYQWHIEPILERFVGGGKGAWKKTSDFLKKVLDFALFIVSAPVVRVSGAVLSSIKRLRVRPPSISLFLPWNYLVGEGKKVVYFLAVVVMLVVNKRPKKIRYYEIDTWPVELDKSL